MLPSRKYSTASISRLTAGEKSGEEVVVQPEKQRTSTPFEQASVLSKLFCCWVNPIMEVGAQQPLQEEDIPELGWRDSADRLCYHIERTWHDELSRDKPSLVRAICRAFGLSYVVKTVLSFLIIIATMLSQPILLGKIVEYISGTSSLTRKDAYLYAVAFCLIGFAKSSILHVGTFVGQQEFGMHIRTALTALIYKKMLLLSHSAVLKVRTGHIVNLVSTDVQRFDQVGPIVHSTWMAPILICSTLVLLWQEVGASSLVGMGFLLVIVVVQVSLSRTIARIREKTALLTDKRIRLMSEIIMGMQLIKMFTWESPFEKVINQVRRKESRLLKKREVVLGMNHLFYDTGVSLVAFVIFSTYVWSNHELSASKVFVSLSLIHGLKVYVMLMQGYVYPYLAETWVAVRRIQNFLLLESQMGVPGMDKSATEHSKEAFVELYNLSAVWHGDEDHFPSEKKENSENDAGTKESFQLRNINLSVRKNELVALVGTVGSGKSSLLMALLGELQTVSGSSQVQGTVALATQLPWIFSGTVRENILFGSDFNAELYQTVLSSCALDKDVADLPFGDLTLVGERGVKLSGGQKARISLARAVYQNADIYLLDDPLSAVDATVGRHLYDKCLRGVLADKPVVLVTHQLQYLQNATRIVVLEEGGVKGVFTFDQLMLSGLDIVHFLGKVDREQKTDRAVDSASDRKASSSATTGSGEDNEAEDRLVGHVARQVYWKFLRVNMSVPWIIVLLFGCLIAQGSLTTTDWWLAYWSSYNDTRQVVTIVGNNSEVSLEEEHGNNFFILIFGILILVSYFLALARGIALRVVVISSSTALHRKMLDAILRTPMLFFNSHPSGRILNRFAKDIGLMDEMLPLCMYDSISLSLHLLAMVIFSAAINPWILLALVPMAFISLSYCQAYLKPSREVKRLEAIARSPIFSHFSASLQGLTTIRAYHQQERFQEEFHKALNFHSRAWLIYLAMSRWLSVRLELMGAALLTVVTFSALLVVDYDGGENLSAGVVGLSLVYISNLSGSIQWTVRMWAEVENLMTSTERVMTYTQLNAEPEPKKPITPPAGWPKYGIITGERVTFRYKPDNPPVLKSLNFCIRHNEKVGIIGRTGAGKSSLVNALYRLAPPSGNLMIDGVPLADLRPTILRRSLSIIPQDPVLFSGTLRYNLDPFDRYADQQLWNALELVQLKPYVQSLPGGLDSEVAEHGSNFSVGQRQLVCLARALICRNRILLIDEATANVDHQTDATIQAAIREHFKDCTVVTIAHRLNTVMDSDRIMVIQDGRIKEMDEPLSLLQKPDGVFAEMVRQLGPAESARLREACPVKHYQESFV